jgi:hypothetical protein
LNEEFGFRLSGVLNLIDEDHKHEPGAPYECYVEGRVTAGDSIGRPPAALGFWNLNWANKVVIQPDLRRQPIRFPLPLAGGVAQPLIDSMLAWINQGLSEAINFLAVELAARLSAGGFGPPDFPHFVATAT